MTERSEKTGEEETVGEVGSWAGYVIPDTWYVITWLRTNRLAS